MHAESALVHYFL